MAEVNTSIYAPPPPSAPPNLLGMIGQFATTQNALNQNAMFQQEIAARKAMGPLFQAAIDPVTGHLNEAKLMAGLAHPAVAWKAPEMINMLVQRGLTTAQTMKAVAETQTMNAKLIGHEALGWLANAERLSGGNPAKMEITDAMLISSASRLIAGGMDNEKVIKSLLDFKGATPEKRVLMAHQLANQARDAGAVADDYLGTFKTHGTGAAQRTMLERRASGTVQEARGRGANLEMMPTPAERNAPVTTMNPQGETHAEPAATVLPMTGGMGTPAPGTPVMPSAGAVPGPGTMPRASAAPGPEGSPPAVPGPAGPMVGRGPFAAEQDKKMAEQGQKYREDSQNAQKQKVIFSEVANTLTRNPKLTGGGAEFRQELARLTQGIPGISRETADKLANSIVGGGPNSLADLQIVKSHLMLLGTTALREFMQGAGRFTNIEFNSFLDAVSKIDKDPKALMKVLQTYDKLADLAIKKEQAFQYWIGQKHPVGGFESAWAEQLYSNKHIRTADEIADLWGAASRKK